MAYFFYIYNKYLNPISKLITFLVKENTNHRNLFFLIRRTKQIKIFMQQNSNIKLSILHVLIVLKVKN